MKHEGTPVSLGTGETVRYICLHCLVVVKHRGGDWWVPYSDDGQPLPEHDWRL